jgi:hypothetical protein
MHILKIVHVTNKWLVRASGLANYRHDEERIIDVGILCCCHLLSTGYLTIGAFSMSSCKWFWSYFYFIDQDQDGVAFVWHSLFFVFVWKKLPVYVVHSHLIRKNCSKNTNSTWAFLLFLLSLCEKVIMNRCVCM